MSENLIYGLVFVSIVLFLLLIYVLSILRAIREESQRITEQTNRIQMQGLLNERAIDKLDSDVSKLDLDLKPEVITDGISRSSGALKGAMAISLKELKIQEGIEEIKARSKTMEDVEKDLRLEVRKIQRIFDDKQEGSKWGEMLLEESLKDAFGGKVNMRTKIPKINAIPDAHIQLHTKEILCIDSKFPMKSYLEVIEDKGDSMSAKKNTNFNSAIKGHIDKVASSYVRPQEGTTKFAYMYIPSEGIYQRINKENQDLIHYASEKGVIICSPNSILAYMHLHYLTDNAHKIGDRTDELQKKIAGLRKNYNELSETWNKLSTHINNSYTNRSKMQDVMQSLERAVEFMENSEAEY